MCSMAMLCLYVLCNLCTAVIASTLPPCLGQYRYVPSDLESRWVSTVADYSSNHPAWAQGCKKERQDRPFLEQWLRYNEQLRNSSSSIQANVNRQVLPDVISYFTLAPNATGAGCSAKTRYLPIEPLAVALRHPHWPCQCRKPDHGGRCSKKVLFSTDWLVFVPPHLYTPVRRAYFFDLGSTYYDAGVAGEADSLKQFVHKYRTLAEVEFDEIFAWEAKPIPHRSYWNRVDLDMVHKIHFFNSPTSANLTDPMSALRMIVALVHPNDFVVFKLDIDNSAVEAEIILAILESPALIARIDELFWEHHVQGSPTMWAGWGGPSNLKGRHSTLLSSYQLFTRLRQAGIRAHSWI
uniref:Uncharacterized protein n=1 Tax=Eutreptiella gymnastica TaxID=73025 RepID=A0A7S1I8A8_9EUGL